MNPITSVNQDNIKDCNYNKLNSQQTSCNETIKLEQINKDYNLYHWHLSQHVPEIKQVIGRAVRISSNHKLPEKKYPVKITILDQ